MLSPETMERLAQPLDPARVKSREGSRGMSLSYIEAHDAIRTANDIFGIGGWAYTVKELRLLGDEPTENRSGKKGWRVGYLAVVEVFASGFEFSDVGYGDSVEYTGSKLTPHELAAKEAVSDGIKRCLKNYGDQFGLVLYDKKGREALERRKRVGESVASMKREVWEIAKKKLGVETPKGGDVAKLWKVKVADLGERETLEAILKEEGVL